MARIEVAIEDPDDRGRSIPISADNPMPVAILEGGGVASTVYRKVTNTYGSRTDPVTGDAAMLLTRIQVDILEEEGGAVDRTEEITEFVYDEEA